MGRIVEKLVKLKYDKISMKIYKKIVLAIKNFRHRRCSSNFPASISLNFQRFSHASSALQFLKFLLPKNAAIFYNRRLIDPIIIYYY